MLTVKTGKDSVKMWTSSVCFMCTKTFTNTTKFSTFSSKRIALFFERFLNLPPESPLISILCSQRNQSSTGTSSSSSFLDQICSECSQILDATFQLYNELCEVRLKMAWRLGQWEALLKVDEDEASKPSSKLSLLLHQKLAEQLHLDLGMGNCGSREVRKMRNLLLSHCKKARNQMLDQRNLEVTLDRCSVPFPVARQGKSSDSDDCGTTTTSFLVLDVDADFNPSSLSKDVDKDVDVVVKRELEDQEFECADDDDFAAMDFEADDFPNTDPKQELTPGSSSTAPVQENVATARRRRSTKKSDFCYFPKKIKKPPVKKVKVVKVKKAKVKKEKNINSDSGISCQLCGITKADLKILKRHLQHHIVVRFGFGSSRPAPTFQCRFCWKSFIFEQQRWIHEQIGTHDKGMTSMKFTCYEESCNGNPPFSSFNDLEVHFESVHQTNIESVHKCSRCQWPFTSEDMQQIHELTHEHYPKTDGNQTKTFKCPKCEAQDFSAFASLQTHFISEHTEVDDVRIYKCKKCSTSYKTAISLEEHLKIHEMVEDLANPEETGAGSSKPSKYHVCEECGKLCATSIILTRHKTQAHRKVQCSLCGKILNSRGLSRHMWQIHQVGDPPQPQPAQYSCPICEKQFRQKSNMKQHIIQCKLQDSEKGEICHICSKTYQRKGLLQRHMRIAHQIEAPELKRPARFVCPDCGMGYYYRNSLTNHIDAKHKSSEERKQNFPCTLCSKTFWRKSVLKKHLEETHAHHVAIVQDEDEEDL